MDWRLIKMLKNLNSFIKNIILEQVTEDKDEKYIKLVYHCNEFYNRYLVDLAEKCEIGVTKQRNNVFLAIGTFKNITKYFNELKVDEMFMEDPSQFAICAPMYCFNDKSFEHKMQRGEGYQPPIVKDGVVTTHEVDNDFRSIIYGRWFDFFENEKKNEKLLKIEPSKFKKYIKNIQKKNKLSDDDIIYIEFSVNCEDWKNNIFEDMVEYRSEEEINEKMIDDSRNLDDDFDYSLAVMPKNDSEDHRKALKDIKVSKKTYKENKLK